MSEFLAYWLQRSMLELIATKADLVMTQKKLIDVHFKLIAVQQKLLCELRRASLKDNEE
jgi:hypothetical protein